MRGGPKLIFCKPSSFFPIQELQLFSPLTQEGRLFQAEKTYSWAHFPFSLPEKLHLPSYSLVCYFACLEKLPNGIFWDWQKQPPDYFVASNICTLLDHSILSVFKNTKPMKTFHYGLQTLPGPRGFEDFCTFPASHSKVPKTFPTQNSCPFFQALQDPVSVVARGLLRWEVWQRSRVTSREMLGYCFPMIRTQFLLLHHIKVYQSQLFLNNSDFNFSEVKQNNRLGVMFNIVRCDYEFY